MSFKKVILLIIAVPLLLTAYQNCSPMEQAKDNESSTTGLTPTGNSQFAKVFNDIIQPKCIECHSAGFTFGELDLSSYDAILESGMVVPGDSSLSKLYTSVASGEMPPIKPLDAEDVAALRYWIDDGAKDEFGNQRKALPVVKAGDDHYIYLGQSSVSLNGSAVDVDGSIVSVEWVQMSGPKVLDISQPNQLATEVTGIDTLGTYEIQLMATDDSGFSVSDRLSISVNQLGNSPPNVGVGLDINIQLPQTLVSIEAFATDPDGSVTSYSWSQLSGPTTATLSNQSTKEVTISNLQLGTYEFKVTVTDDVGAQSSDNILVVVDPVAISRSFKNLNDTIFKPKCLNCHRNGNARGGYNMETYALVMSEVAVNVANDSDLFLRVHDDTMPPGRPLSKAEKDKVRDWINTGAPNN